MHASWESDVSRLPEHWASSPARKYDFCELDIAMRPQYRFSVISAEGRFRRQQWVLHQIHSYNLGSAATEPRMVGVDIS